jgi:uncharacterized linocin/CFP29 family protein
MSHHYLTRDDAPFGDKIWDTLDKTLVRTARGILTGRRMVDVKGPYGLGTTALALGDREVESGILAGNSIQLMYLYKTFSIPKRDLAQFEKTGTVPPYSGLVQAVTECAELEDQIIFNGKKGAAGLVNSKGNQNYGLNPWNETGSAIEDLIGAVTKLDDAGFHGPYTLALSPVRYNLLFRIYERGNTSELEHMRTLVTDGVYKAPVLQKGGVLMASDPSIATIVIGQDMQVGFHGPEEADWEFSVSESIALAVHQPSGVVALTE